jgi:hypothetical protein
MERPSNVSVGFYNHANTHPDATRANILSVKLVYPNAPYVLTCDAGYDFTDMAKEFNVEYFHYHVQCGYPQQPYGYRLPKVLMWMDRMYMGVTRLNTDYFVSMEDDCLLVGELDIDPEWECAGHSNLYSTEPGNDLPPKLLDMIESFSGVRPATTKYNSGGGTIFKTKTFVDNYPRIRGWFKQNLDNIQDSFYPTLGWMDCFMTVYFLLCGRPISINNQLLNIWPPQNPYDVDSTPSHIKLLHNFKNYY